MNYIQAVLCLVFVTFQMQCMQDQLAGETPATLITTAQRLLANAPAQNSAISEQTTAIAYITEHCLSKEYLQEVITYMLENPDTAIASDQGAHNLLYHFSLKKRMATIATVLAYDAAQSRGHSSCVPLPSAAVTLLEESTRSGKSVQKTALEHLKSIYEEVSADHDYSPCQRYESMRFMVTLTKAKKLLKHDISPFRKYWKPMITPCTLIAAGFIATYVMTCMVKSEQAYLSSLDMVPTAEEDDQAMPTLSQTFNKLLFSVCTPNNHSMGCTHD